MENLVKADMPGGGALEADLILGRRPGVSFAYHVFCDEDGDVGDCKDLLSSCLSLYSTCSEVSSRLSSLSCPLLSRSSDRRGVLGGAKPVSSPNSFSLKTKELSVSSSSSSLNTDFRSFRILLIMEKEGCLCEPSRIRSLVYWWWNFGLGGREGSSGSEGHFVRLVRDMILMTATSCYATRAATGDRRRRGPGLVGRSAIATSWATAHENTNTSDEVTPQPGCP